MKLLLTLGLSISMLLGTNYPPVKPVSAEQDAATATEPDAITLQLKGLKDRVVIRRDDRGIPYIEAKNDQDLYFAQGYATAQDRLWQMDLFRRNAKGELSEVLPKIPNSPTLDQDKLHRTLGFKQAVEAEFARASPQSRALLEAYAAGVNAHI